MAVNYIKIRGANQHNLKNVNLDIPRDKLVIITGVSGSGKSSLAFDTIYAEGQRRYVESLSTYARQFIAQMVGTVTEIYDYLRLLFARIGKPHCPSCGKEIKSQTVDMMLATILAYPENTKVTVMAPIVRGKKGEFQKELRKLQKEGFARIRIDGEVKDLSADITLDKNKHHDLDVIVDRLLIRPNIRTRLRDSLELAVNLAGGLVKVEIDSEEILFSEKYACPDCGISLPEIAPRIFSFNSP